MSGSGSGSGEYDDLSVILGDHTLGDLGSGEIIFGAGESNCPSSYKLEQSAA
jgi:hypothetical protein